MSLPYEQFLFCVTFAVIVSHSSCSLEGATADYVSVSRQYQWLVALQNSGFL